jgi:periplasmic protein CpxP/Spy
MEPMNRLFIAAVCVGLAAGSAMAQSNNPSTNTTTNTGSVTNTTANPPAIATPGLESQTQAAPVPGANSFTEAQARARLEDHGYANVTDLKLDDQQIWRGKALKNGASVNVALDYQGNIVSQ